eukprot:gene5-12811_t
MPEIMHATENDHKATAAAEKNVHFADDPSDKETAGLLSSTANGHHSNSPSGAPVDTTYNAHHAYTAPPQVEAGDKFELDPIPASTTSWPRYPLRIACTSCGHFVQTTTTEETEFMGFDNCCAREPQFRRAITHYCPNCSEAVGSHYTGEGDCFCCDDHGDETTLTFAKLFFTCCAAWR